MPTAIQIAPKTITSGQPSPRVMTYQGVPTSAIRKVPVRKAILGTLGWSFAASVTFVLPRGWEAVGKPLLRTSRARRPPGPRQGRLAAARFLKPCLQVRRGLPMTNRKRLGLLWVLPLLGAASSRADGAQAVVAARLPDFDHQLERFTELAMEGKVAAAESFLREPAFIRSVDREGHTALFAATVAGNLQVRSEEHTSELQSHVNLVCRLLL